MSDAQSTTNVRYVASEDALLVATRLLAAVDVEDPAAKAVAEELVDADLRGVMTHGLTRLPLYIGRVVDGTISRSGSPTVTSGGPSAVMIDAKNGFGHLAGRVAMREAVRRATVTGVAAATVFNSTHFGAAGGYARLATDHQCIGIVVSNGPPLLAAIGGAERRVGNNPLAIASPSDAGFPLVFDIALSVVAGWKIQMAYEREEPIPEGWALDSEGKPTTDPYEAFAGGGLLRAVGDHKGFGLALMIEVLTAGLSGGGMTGEVLRLAEPGAMNTCHTFVAIEPGRFAGTDLLKHRVAELCQQVWSSKRMDGVDQLLVPGQLEHETSVERRRSGIPYPEQVWRPVVELADQYGMPHPFGD